MWNDTSPTSSVITLGNHAEVNSSGETYVCYAWHSVDGYSKIGTYSGNGSADGTFVYTGFRPAWVMIKEYSHAGERWHIYDAVRDPVNYVSKRLTTDGTLAESSGASQSLDFVSNGFKIRANNNHFNDASSSYVFLCFAETQQKYANAR